MASSPCEDLGLSSNYVLQVADQLAEQGVEVATWLSHQGLSLSRLREADHLIPWQTVAPLFLQAEQLTSDRSLGLKVGRRLRINTHGVVGFAAMNSSTVRQLVMLFERFVPLRINVVAVHHEEHDQVLRLCVDEVLPLGQNAPFLISAVVTALYNIIDFITLGASRMQSINFAFPAVCDDQFARMLFRCDVKFEQSWNGIALSLCAVDQTLKSADPQAYEQAEALCERELERMQADSSYSGQVRKLILSHQPSFPSLAVTAAMLHMTPRTLHRRLQDEGSSFKQLLNEVRQQIAEECLANSEVGVETLAYTLGYSDASNFRRAFQRWTGQSPSAYRASLHPGADPELAGLG